MDRVANYRIMTTTALSSIGEGPRNFMVNKDVPRAKNNTPAAASALNPNSETMPSKEEK